ncbi:MAG: transposase, partial [Desulfovibrionaceae bacterium]|nr:transposase [Desulfovibrionaceae bacterium]
KLVTELAEELAIILEFFSLYSPNLNLIERFWKFVKATLRTKNYNNFEEFKAKIDHLLGEKVQFFKLNQVATNTYENKVA